MSELIDDSRFKKQTLKHLIQSLHEGTAPEAVRAQLVRLMGQVPYAMVVEVEQELISEKVLSVGEIQKLCDLHSAALKGVLEKSAAPVPPAGHPVDVFFKENRALERVLLSLKEAAAALEPLADDAPGQEAAGRLRAHVAALAEGDKHYKRKEFLLFPFLEKRGITGPPTVMWGKHDEARGLLKTALEALAAESAPVAGTLKSVARLVLAPALDAVAEMIFKEENILLPMCLDALTEGEWLEVRDQSAEIGYCLITSVPEWRPAGAPAPATKKAAGQRLQFPTGSLSVEELSAMLDSLPFDLTFVDKDDRVGYFTGGKERVFARNEAVIGRKVQFCHPPSSVHRVTAILEDFKSGKADRAPFWINMKGRFVHIEYFAVRDREGRYLGTLEVTKDITELRKLEGEQRLMPPAKAP